MLWIALHLPRLPLEALSSAWATSDAHAIVEQRRVLACNAGASAQGIQAGMSPAAARALVPSLHLHERNPAIEVECLTQLAAWAGQFTPAVAIESPAALLLEVEGSLKIFGGIGNILDRLRSGASDMGFTASIACAPTALGALCHARAGKEIRVAASDLRRCLANLPIDVLDIETNARAALAAIGANTLGDILALPRDGFARRFGPKLLDLLDRALGQRADPRQFFEPPPVFHARIELPAEVENTDTLLFAARRLLVQLEGWLAARAGGVQRFLLRLAHRDAPATEIAIGLVSPGRDAAHFTRLVRERLAQVVLPEPARALSIHAEEIVTIAGESIALFHDAADAGDRDRLVETLKARLGETAIHGLCTVDEHRPEKASREIAMAPRRAPPKTCVADTAPNETIVSLGKRPFWLLPEPRLLRDANAVPDYGGPLRLLIGPERIESGWWDGEPVARDYYVARTPQQSLVWIYREARLPCRWFLHGFFA